MTAASELAALFEQIDRPPTFTARAEPIPGDLRLSWRLTALTMILERSRGAAAPLAQVSVLWWAMRSPAARERFLRWYAGQASPDEILVRYDPTVSVTVDLALGLGLVTRAHNGVLHLAESGKRVAAIAWSTDGYMPTEKDFLNELPKKITQKMVNELLAGPKV